jgi:hypothetical protein
MMSSKRTLVLLAMIAGLACLLVGPSVHGNEIIWTTDRTIRAKDKPKPPQKGLFELKKGESVKVLGKTKNHWIKIENPANPSQKGYVPAKALKPPQMRAGESQPPKFKNKREEAPEKAAGVILVYSYLNQPARVYQDATPPVEFSALTGSSFYFGGFFELILSDTLKGRAGVQMRKIELSGTSKVVSGVATTPASLQVSQDFFGAFLSAQYRLSERFWAGGGGEVSQAMRSTVTTGGSSDQPERPLYVLIQASTGYDFYFSNILFSPELRIGFIVNSTPMMMNVELVNSIGYRF